MRIIKAGLSAFVAAACLSTPPVFAEAADDSSGFGISLGLFVTDRESKSRLRGDLGNPATDIDLESDLGLDRSDNVFRIDGYYRFNDRHRIDFSAFDLSRSKRRVIDEEVMWGDTVYPVNANIRSEFDLEIYKLAYTWSFMRREQGYLGLTAGLYIASFGATISEAQLGSVGSDSLTAPLPVFGLRGEYALSERFTLRGSAEVFALEYEEYDGVLTDFYLGVDYQLFDRTSIGVGINSVQLDIGIERNSFDGNFDWRYDGGLLFVRFDF